MTRPGAMSICRGSQHRKGRRGVFIFDAAGRDSSPTHELRTLMHAVRQPRRPCIEQGKDAGARGTRLLAHPCAVEATNGAGRRQSSGTPSRGYLIRRSSLNPCGLVV
jgi:hypothetical protein